MQHFSQSEGVQKARHGISASARACERPGRKNIQPAWVQEGRYKKRQAVHGFVRG